MGGGDDMCPYCRDTVGDRCKHCGRKWAGPNKQNPGTPGPMPVDQAMRSGVGYRLGSYLAWGGLVDIEEGEYRR